MRTELALSGGALAATMGVGRSHVTHMIAGRRPIGAEHVEALAGAHPAWAERLADAWAADYAPACVRSRLKPHKEGPRRLALW